MARLSVLHAKGLIEFGQVLQHRSVIGTRFWGRLIGETHVGDQPGVIAEIQGSAHITGFNNIMLEAEDPFREGFHLDDRGRHDLDRHDGDDMP
jgi:proline racemase